MKGLNKFVYVGGVAELSKLVQEKAFELGYGWGFSQGEKVIKNLHANYLFFGTWETKGIAHSSFTGHSSASEMSVADFLNQKPETKTITIDGKDIELSEESFQSLREQLVEGV